MGNSCECSESIPLSQAVLSLRSWQRTRVCSRGRERRAADLVTCRVGIITPPEGPRLRFRVLAATFNSLFGEMEIPGARGVAVVTAQVETGMLSEHWQELKRVDGRIDLRERGGARRSVCLG